MKKYIVGITGASGSIYGTRIVEELLKENNEVHLIITDNGVKVLEYELEISFENWIDSIDNGNLVIPEVNDMFARVASGSFITDGMVISPCSMGTLSKISNGITDNLLIRAADVIIKEQRKLILIPRETPLNSIHLKNMLTLSNLGVNILPPMPAFYNRPKSIEEIVNFTVGKVLRTLGVNTKLHKEWNGA